MLKAALFALLLPLSTAQAASIVATVPPAGMIVRLLQPNANISVLVPPGASAHLFDPAPSDIRKVQDAALLIWVAPELDSWAGKLLAKEKFVLRSALSEPFWIRYADDHGESHDGHKHEGVDPHFWTDPLAVSDVLPKLAEVLCLTTPADCGDIRKRLPVARVELKSLHEEVSALLAPVKGRAAVLFHPSFLYLFQRYGLKAAEIIEPVPGKEPSAKEIFRMLSVMREQKVKAVFTEPQLPKRPAQVLAESSGARLGELDPQGGGPGRTTYAEFLRYNAKALAEALR